MRVGWVGLGKLGLPCALVLADRGHQVVGYDVNPKVLDVADNKWVEPGVSELLDRNNYSNFHVAESLGEVVLASEVVFVAVQTPHAPKYGGEVPVPEETRDFEYSYLIQVVRDISRLAEHEITIVVVSTVLPGTTQRELKPLLTHKVKLGYSPLFIAMGTVIHDFQNPEFLLIGIETSEVAEVISRVYQPVHTAPRFVTTIPNAEMIKVAYNTFISMKIVWGNHLSELCDATGVDSDAVVAALSLGTDRVISNSYLRAGMGDGGACFLAGNLVITKSGPKSIESIESGDLVLVEDGTFAPVMQRHERYYRGNIVKVKVEGLPATTATVGHKWWVRKDGRKVCSNGRRKATESIKSKLSQISQVAACDLIPGEDFALWPIVTEKVQSPAHVTDDYLLLAGWYLSDGSLDCRYTTTGNLRNGRVGFHLNNTTKLYAVGQIKDALLRCYPPHTTGRGAGATVAVVYHEPHNVSIRYGNVDLARQLLDDFGSGTHSKRLPEWVLYGDLNIQLKVLAGLFGGDGTWGSRSFCYTTVYSDLAYGALTMLEQLGICANLGYKPKRKHLSNGGFIGSGAYYEVRVRNYGSFCKLANLLVRSNRAGVDYERSPVISGARARRIIKVEESEFSGNVYNLWIDHPSHSYVTSSGLVSNCHPRDLIALTDLEHRTGSGNLFEFLAKTRDDQTRRLADKVADWVDKTSFPVVVLGAAYKPEVPLTEGSPALLLLHYLNEAKIRAECYDPVTSRLFGEYDLRSPFAKASIYVLATAHEQFITSEFPTGSVVIDPWGLIPNQAGVTLVRIGRK